MVRLRRDGVVVGVCIVAGGLATPTVAQSATFFTDPAAFQQAMLDVGKLPKFGRWDFKPDAVGGTTSVLIPNGLNIRTHSTLAPGVWKGLDGITLWPSDVDNTTFTTNANPTSQGPLVPGGGLKYLKPNDPVKPIDNNALLANIDSEAFSILSGPVNTGGPNHTAMEFDILSTKWTGAAPLLIITVFNKSDVILGKFQLTPGAAVSKQYLGILVPFGDTIGRVDIWDKTGGKEGISSITAYIVPSPGSIALLGFAGLAARRRRRRA